MPRVRFYLRALLPLDSYEAGICGFLFLMLAIGFVIGHWVIR